MGEEPAALVQAVMTERKPLSSLHKTVFVFSAVLGPGSNWGRKALLASSVLSNCVSPARKGPVYKGNKQTNKKGSELSLKGLSKAFMVRGHLFTGRIFHVS